MFRLIGLPNSPDISSGAAEALAGTDRRHARGMLAELCRAHLLTRQPGDRYVFHDLLRAYARERAHTEDPEQERTAALQRLLDHYLYTCYAANQRLAPGRLLPELEYTDSLLRRDFATYEDALAWWDTEHTSVLAAIRQGVTLGMPHGPLLAHVATFPFKLRGLLEELKVSSTDGIKGAQETGDRSVQARLLADLGTAHYFRGEHDAALRCQQAALQLFSELDEKQWEIAIHATLAEIYIDLRRYQDAADSARQALRMQDDADDQGPDEGTAHGVLGLALAHLDDFNAALDHLHRALSVSSDFSRGYILTNLGAAYLYAGDVDNALGAYRRAVEQNRAIGYQLGEAKSLNKLGEALDISGDAEGARDAWQAALAIFVQQAHPAAETVRTHLDAIDTAYPE